MRTLIFILIIITILAYQLGYDNGRIDTQIEVMKKVNSLLKLPIEKRIERLRTDWLHWND